MAKLRPQLRFHGCATVNGKSFDLGKFEQGAFACAPAAAMSAAVLCLHNTATHPLAKEDYWQLARIRRIPKSSPALWKMSVSALAASCGAAGTALTGQEDARLAVIQIKRAEYAFQNPCVCQTLTALKAAMRQQNLPCSEGLTKGGMVDALLAAVGQTVSRQIYPNRAALDAQQAAVVERGVELATTAYNVRRALPPATRAKNILVSAGPGAGKTSTLTNLIAAILSGVPSARVAVLAFNVGAEATLRQRLRAFGVNSKEKMIPKSQLFVPGGGGGCAVLTFDKLAYRVCEHKAQLAVAASLAGGATAPPPANRTYRQTKENAGLYLAQAKAAAVANAPTANPYDTFDLVIVDEAQDVTGLEASIVEGLLATANTGLVAAGDPRQEVYTGANWYSKLWAAGVAAPAATAAHILPNNYRSAPEIVDALNAFSRSAFPSLHHDQVAVRPRAAPGSAPAVQIVCVPKKATPAETNSAVGEQVGAIMARHGPASCYGLAPVTLSEFRVGEVTTSARQTLYEHRPADIAVALIGEEKIPDGDVFVLATSRRIKGTERDNVVVFGADRDYNILVHDSTLAKLFYVAISRARDSLVLVTQRLERQRIKLLLDTFVRACTPPGGASVVMSAGAVSRPRKQKLVSVPVTGESLAAGGAGVADIAYAPDVPWSAAPAALPRLCEFPTNSGGRDFAGRLAEAHFAQGLMVAWETKTGRTAARPPLASFDGLKIVVSRSKEEFGIFYDEAGGGYVLCTSQANCAVLEQFRAECVGTCSPYVHAMLKFTALCGQTWTAGCALAEAEFTRRVSADAKTSAGGLLDLALTLLNCNADGLAEPKYWGRGKFPLSACRPDGKSASTVRPSDATVGYETDFVLTAGAASVPVEFKYTGQLTATHETQLYSYMEILGCPVGVLFNGASGEARVLRKTPPPTTRFLNTNRFVCHARTLHALRNAKSAALTYLAEFTIRPPANLVSQKYTAAVSFDIESDEHKNTTEIGAVAVSLTDWSVIGTFQARAPSMRPTSGAKKNGNTTKKYIENLVGLERAPGGGATAADEGKELERAFLGWCAELSPRCVFMHWSGSDRSVIGDAAAVDVYQECFIPWLDLKTANRGRRNNTSLSCAMSQLLPHLPFAAHQAFEDALGCLAAAVAMVDLSSTV
jgi:hypothetical protein